MAFLAILPSLAWLILVIAFPQWQVHVPELSLPIALTYAAVNALLVLFFRQWRWLYWPVWLAAVVYGFNVGIAPDALLVWTTISALLMAALPMPSARSASGMALVALLAVSPFTLQLPAVAPALAQLNPVPLMTIPELTAGSAQFSHWLFVVGVGGLWATVLLYRSAAAYSWAQLGAWLALTHLFSGSVADNVESSLLAWTLTAALTGLLIALADQLLRLSYIDELTGLPQRRALLSHLQHLGRRSTVCMLDVDHFKKFNDRYGHDAGDQVLRLLGKLLSRNRRVKAYRYGGEEFTLVLPYNDENRVKEQLDDLRSAVASYPFSLRSSERAPGDKSAKTKKSAQHAAKTVKVTISLGATPRQKGDNADTVLKRADKNLYAAKKAGRNRVIVK